MHELDAMSVIKYYVLYAVIGAHAWQQRMGSSQDTNYLSYQDTIKVGREREREGGREKERERERERVIPCPISLQEHPEGPCCPGL